MKNFATASFVFVLVWASSAFGQIVDPVPQDASASTWHIFSGVGANYIKPLGGDLDKLFNVTGAPDYQLKGVDLSAGVRGKGHLRGPLYLGGGLKLAAGWAQEDIESDIKFMEDDYLHLGADAFVELGLRFPVGRTQHFDLGAQVGGSTDFYNAQVQDEEILQGVMWVGPAIALEPNAGTQGFLAGASLRLPVAGTLKLEGDFDEQWHESGGYMARVEAGWVFQRGFTLVGYGEFGGYKFDNSDLGSFTQDHWTAGLEVRMTF